MVEGRGSAELFGDPERSSSQAKGSFWGRAACMWDELWVVPAALAQTESQSSPTWKKMAEEGVKGKIHWPLPHLCCQVCTAGLLLPVQGVLGHQDEHAISSIPACLSQAVLSSHLRLWWGGKQTQTMLTAHRLELIPFSLCSTLLPQCLLDLQW